MFLLSRASTLRTPSVCVCVCACVRIFGDARQVELGSWQHY